MAAQEKIEKEKKVSTREFIIFLLNLPGFIFRIFFPKESEEEK